jgi:hypothetical protein
MPNWCLWAAKLFSYPACPLLKSSRRSRMRSLELLHRGERRSSTTKTICEIEAEAVAFVVCSAVHLKTTSASQDYIGLYHGDADMLLESLEHIQRAASGILNALEIENADGAGRE